MLCGVFYNFRVSKLVSELSNRFKNASISHSYFITGNENLLHFLQNFINIFVFVSFIDPSKTLSNRRLDKLLSLKL